MFNLNYFATLVCHPFMLNSKCNKLSYNTSSCRITEIIQPLMTSAGTDLKALMLIEMQGKQQKHNSQNLGLAF